MTKSTWKIVKLDWKTPGIFFFQKMETLTQTELVDLLLICFLYVVY